MLRRNNGALNLAALEISPSAASDLQIAPSAAADIDSIRSSLSSPSPLSQANLRAPLLFNTTFSQMTTVPNTTKPVIKTPNPHTPPPIPPVPKRSPLK